MRIRAILLLMLVTGAGLLLLADFTDSVWPLFAIWPAHALAILLARDPGRESLDAGPDSPIEDQD